MKNSKVNKFIAKVVLSILQFIDRTLFKVERYEGETAPYCGHAYNGFNGRFVKGHWTEVGGEYGAYLFWGRLYFGNHDDEGFYSCWSLFDLRYFNRWGVMRLQSNVIYIAVQLLRLTNNERIFQKFQNWAYSRPRKSFIYRFLERVRIKPKGK